MVFVGTLIIFAIVPLDAAVALCDLFYALMAFPTMITILRLRKDVRAETDRYFAGNQPNRSLPRQQFAIKRPIAYLCVMITPQQRTELEEKVVEMLRTVYDPEIPVDVYSLGLIYLIDIDDDANLHINMTLTAPNCPAADFIIEDMRIKLESIEGIKSVDINIVFEPEWNKDMMSEEAKLELGFL